MTKATLHFVFEKETKNTRRYQEQSEEGRPPVVGTLYVQKWAVGKAERLVVTVEEEKAIQ